MPRKALVTGGAGFIGRHLLRALLEAGQDVRVLDNLSSGSEASIPERADFHRGDILNPQDVAAAMSGCDIVYHLAGNASGTLSVENPRFDFEANAVGTFNLLEAALAGDVRRFVYVSSASVYGVPRRFPIDEEHPLSPFVPYGASKLVGERYCRTYLDTYGLPSVIARPFCVYGPGENPELALVEVARYLRWHLNGATIQIVGDADRKTRDFVHVDDVVRGLLILAESGKAGEAYNIGSGEETSMRQLADLVGSFTDREVDLAEIREVMEDTYRLVASVSKLAHLGYSPTMSLERGVRQLAEEMGASTALPMGSTIFHPGQAAEE
ncbi:MAG: NAD-dependent epimerase/dehydratase family protein [candidate division NC10 bacterium]